MSKSRRSGQFSLRAMITRPEPPPRRSVAGAIDDIFRQAAQAEAAQRRRQETESRPVKQLTRAQLKAMTPEQINEARRSGRLRDLLGPPADTTTAAERRIRSLELDGITQLASVEGMTATEINEAREQGRLTALMCGIEPPSGDG